MKYDVSVLVPVYNVSKFIERCLHSLFGQTFPNIQYVFVDDCSPDRSVEIIQEVLKEYPKRKNDVKIIKHEKNRGLAAARNTGIENAEGEFILHIDSDDYIELDMVEQLFLKAREEGADIVVCDYFLEWEKTRKYINVEIGENKEKYLDNLLDSSASPAVWNKMFRKEIYTKHDITTHEGINFGEDFTVTPKLVYFARRIAKVDQAFVHYVQYNANSYTKKITDKNISDISITLENLQNFFSKTTNSNHYLRMLEKSKLQKKLEFIKHIEGQKLKPLINNFYYEIKDVDPKSFGLFDRILLCLSRTNIPLLRMVTYTYKKIFESVQLLKGR